MRPRLTLTLVILCVCALEIVSCSGADLNPQADTNDAVAASPVTLPVADPVLLAEDPFGVVGQGKRPSATFRKFYLDSVNAQSTGRWTVADEFGYKHWVLSNTYNSAPKGWRMGGNYWNHELDRLTTIPFELPITAQEVKLTFTSRWSIAAGDEARVQFSADGGASWDDLAYFSAGANPNYPLWDKYIVFLPTLEPGQGTESFIRIVFQSDGSGTDFGICIDDVAVYQTDPEPPQNVTASDGTVVNGVRLSWERGARSTPDSYSILRSNAADGDYVAVGSAPGDATEWYETAMAAPSWYKIQAIQTGYASQISAADSGYAEVQSWTAYALPQFESEPTQAPSLEYIDGAPSLAFTSIVDSLFTRIMYRRSATALAASPTDWGTATQLFSNLGSEFFSPDHDFDLGQRGSLPIVAMHNEHQTRLYRATSVDPASWSWSLLPENAMLVHQALELGGNPAVLYSTATGLHLLRAADTDGTTWNTAQSLSTGAPLSLIQLLGGLPTSLVEDGTPELLQSIAADGTGIWTTLGSVPGEASSFASVAGHPVVAYSRDGAVYLRHGSTDATSWSEERLVAEPAGTLEGLFLASVAERATIGYREHQQSGANPSETVFRVEVVQAFDEHANHWSEPQTAIEWTLSSAQLDTAATLADLHIIDAGGYPALAGTLVYGSAPAAYYGVRH